MNPDIKWTRKMKNYNPIFRICIWLVVCLAVCLFVHLIRLAHRMHSFTYYTHMRSTPQKKQNNKKNKENHFANQ